MAGPGIPHRGAWGGPRGVGAVVRLVGLGGLAAARGRGFVVDGAAGPTSPSERDPGCPAAGAGLRGAVRPVHRRRGVPGGAIIEASRANNRRELTPKRRQFRCTLATACPASRSLSPW